MLSEIPQKERKTTILGINRAPEGTSVSEIASLFKDYDVCLVKKIRSKHFATANFLIEFGSSEDCEQAKQANESATIGSEVLTPFFASSDALQQHRTVVSDNKLYVKYPRTVEKESVMDLLKDFKLVEPTNEGNFLFIVCKDQSEQFEIKQRFDGQMVEGKPINVSFAINKVKRLPVRTRKTYQ